MDIRALQPDTIVLAGDWHGNAKAAAAAFALAADVGATAVVQLGDFGVWPGHSAAAYLDFVSDLTATAGIPLLFVDGNHEDFDQLDATAPGEHGVRVLRPGVNPLHRGFRFTWHGLRFLALGGATSVDRRGRSHVRPWWPQEEVSDEEAAHVRSGGVADVVLMHDCPAGIPIPGTSSDLDVEGQFWPIEYLRHAWRHRERLRDVLADVDPTHIFHGHYHRRYTHAGDLFGTPLEVDGLSMETDDGAVLVVDVLQLAGRSRDARGSTGV